MVNRDLTAQRLSEIPNVSLTKPGGAFYCFPDVSHYGTSQEVADRLLDECNVLTIPGIAFGQRGNNYIRISYAADVKELDMGLKAIKGVLS